MVGEIAHIISPAAEGPRYDPAFPKDKLNKADNLVMFCPVHHAVIDDQPDQYSAAELKKMREDHGRRCLQEVQKTIPSISYLELEVVVRHLAASPDFQHNEDYHLLSIKDKIKRNNLSARVEKQISVGLLKVHEVKNFIETMNKVDPLFSERLVSGFSAKYLELKTQNQEPDSIFFGLLGFAEGKNPSFAIRAASLAVLTYLFECCEVFEK